MGRIVTVLNLFLYFVGCYSSCRVVFQYNIICYNVSADAYIDPIYQNSEHRTNLYIYDSIIPKIPKNSSLSRFTRMGTLYLEYLQIKEIAPGAFDGISVKELHLSSNNLTKISKGVFNNLELLEKLDLSNNSVSEIEEDSFLGLTNLKMLYLHENQITYLSSKLFKDLKKLEGLWVSQNPLKNFPSDISLPSLRIFENSESNLKTFDWDLSQQEGEDIRISQGKLESIDFGKLPKNLERLNLDENKITTIKNWNSLNCEFVYLNENNISNVEIPDNVTRLYVTGSFVENVKSLVSSNPKKMKFLNLSNNTIVDLSTESFWGLTELETLYLQYNKIEILRNNIFINCTNLKDVDFNHNKIKTIEPLAFAGATKLGMINLMYNNLEHLNLESFEQLNNVRIILGKSKVNWNDVKTLLFSDRNITVEVNPEFLKCIKDYRLTIYGNMLLTANVVNKTGCFDVNNE